MNSLALCWSVARFRVTNIDRIASLWFSLSERLKQQGRPAKPSDQLVIQNVIQNPWQMIQNYVKFERSTSLRELLSLFQSVWR